MEDIDGGLHPAVDGQSLDDDEDEERHSRLKSRGVHLFETVTKERHSSSLTFLSNELYI